MQELVSYAPIKVLSTSPMQANEGSHQGIRINFPPEQGNLTYKVNIKLRIFQLTVKDVGIRPKFLPHSKEITFQEDQIPYYSPRSACAWKLVRQNFDR